MGWQDYIHSDPEIFAGKPVIKGTRLSVEFLLGLFAAGWTSDQVLENYPALTSAALQAVFAPEQGRETETLVTPLELLGDDHGTEQGGSGHR